MTWFRQLFDWFVHRDRISIAHLTIHVLMALRKEKPANLVSQAMGVSATEGESEGVTCDLVNNVEWWPANGFSDDERRAMGRDLGCPGF